MHRTLASLAAFALLAPLASAQIDARPGDVLVCKFNPFGPSSLQHTREDGTPVSNSGGPTSWYMGAVITADGRYATTTREPNSVRLFDAGGVETAWFATPEVDAQPADIDVFSDGTLVVVDYGGELELYDPSGVHQGTFTAPGLNTPFGVHVDAEDNVWCCDYGGQAVYQWDRQGNLLQSFDVNFDPGDLVRDPDGTLWITTRYYNYVWNYSASGDPLSSFLPEVNGFGYLQCLGLYPDGTLALAKDNATSVSRYSRTGQLLGTTPIAGEGKNMFLQVVGQRELGSVYCSGDGVAACPCLNPGASGEGCANSTGVGGRLRAAGWPSVTSGQVTFGASQLVPGKPALLFAGTSAVQGGVGTPFGDGLRCAGGSVVRLGVSMADAAGDASWGPGVLTGGGFGAGTVRRFQAWFRDPVGSPCGSGFNLSNGVELTMLP